MVIQQQYRNRDFTALMLLHPATARYREISGHRVTLNTHAGVRYVCVDDIVYCKAESNYCHVILQSGERIFLSKTLKWISAELPAGRFIRVHASYLVNAEQVEMLSRSSIQLQEGIDLPVARSRAAEVRRRLMAIG